MKKHVSMGKKFLGAAFLCLLSSLSIYGASNSLVIPQNRQAPDINGEIASGEWTKSAAISGLLRLDPSPVLMENKEGTVYICADSNNIYIRTRTSATNNDPGGGLVANARKHDGAVYDDDSIEIVLFSPSNGFTSHLIVNSAGTIFDRCQKGATGNIDMGWNCAGIQTSSIAKAGIWELEMKIPRQSVGIFGNAFRFNVVRNWFGRGTSALVPTANYLDKNASIGAEIISGAPGIQMKSASTSNNEGVGAEVAYPSSEGVPVEVDFQVKTQPKQGHAEILCSEKKKVLPPGGIFNASCPPTGKNVYEYALTVYESKTKRVLLERSFLACRGTRKSGDIPATKEFNLSGIGRGAVFYYPSSNKAVVELEAQSRFIEKIAVNCNDKATVLKNVNGIFRGTISVPSVPGIYAFDISVDGKTFADAFSLEKRVYPWQGNSLGKSRTIIPPFTSISADGTALNILLRTIRFGGTGLPESVIADGAEILAGPANFEITVNGKTQKISGSTPEIKVDADGYSAEISGQSNMFSLNSTLEYDGFLWNTLKLNNVSGKTVDRLTLVIPLKDDAMKYMHAIMTGSIRSNPSCRIPAGSGIVWSGDQLKRNKLPGGLNAHPQFVPYLWLGGERKGLAFFMESSFGTRLDKDRPAVRLVRKNNILRLEVDFINHASRLKDGHKIEFGLQATPVKNVDKNLARLFQSSRPLYPEGMDLFLFFCESSMFGYHNNWSRHPYNDDWELLRQGLKLCRDEGKSYEAYCAELTRWDAEYADKCRKLFAVLPKVDGISYFDWFMKCRQYQVEEILPKVTYPPKLIGRYSDPTLCTFFSDVENYYQTEWVSRPTGYLGAVRCFMVPSYMDYIVYNHNKEMDNGLQAIYLDDMFLIECRNPETAAVKDENGYVHFATGILEMRELVKRLAILQHEHGFSPRLLQIHSTNALLVPCFSFATSLIVWEDHFGEKVYQERYSEEYIATESRGTQIGAESVALDGIYRRKTPVEEWRSSRFEFLTRTQLAMLLPNNIKISVRINGPYTGVHIPTIMQALGVLGKFGVADEDCEFVPYWDSDDAITGQPKYVKLSSWRKPDMMLIALGNQVKETAKFLLHTKDKGYSFFNAETGVELPEGKVELGGYDYMLVLACKTPPTWLPVVKNVELSNDFQQGWTLNPDPAFKPFGTVRQTGPKSVELKSNGKHTAIFTKDQIPLREGEQLTVSATVSGSGSYMIGLYQYGSKVKWQWRGQVGSNRTAAQSPQTVRITLTPNKPDIKNVCVFLAVDKDATVTFSDLTAMKYEK